MYSGAIFCRYGDVINSQLVTPKNDSPTPPSFGTSAFKDRFVIWDLDRSKLSNSNRFYEMNSRVND